MKTYGVRRSIPGSHMPGELTRFLKQDSFFLLVKGAAGTGKTSLALTILNVLGIRDNCLYISTRTSPDQIIKQYPWLTGFFDESQLYGKNKAELSRADLPVFIDAKLAETAEIFEMITNKLMDTRAPIIIIDAWDAIEYSRDKEALISNIRVLDTWCRRASAKLILITEQPKDTTIDFLADGVVVLKQGYYNDRRIREIEFLKLSGVQITKPSYLFTLKNRIFKSYGPHNPRDFVVTRDWINPTHKVGKLRVKESGLVTTGHKELDSLLGGGFPARGIVNVELDSDVNPKVAVVFLSETISNFVDANNSVLFLPFEGLDQGYIDHHLRINSTDSSTRELAGMSIHHDTRMSRLVTVEQANLSLDRKLRSFQEILLKMRKDHPDKFLLNIMGSDIVQICNQEAGEHLQSLIDFLRSNTDLSVIVSRRSLGTAYISGISDIYLKITDMKGTLLLQPQKPWSNLYAISLNKRAGHARMRLEPLV